MTTSKNNNQKTFFIVTILVLLGIIGFLIINNFQQSKEVSIKEDQLEEAAGLQADLERQYYESLSELESLRGTNEELNTMIDAQKEELKQQKNQIAQLIKTKSDFNAAKAQIADLKVQTTKYVEELEELKAKNKELESVNQELSSANINLQEAVEKTKMEKDQIMSEKTNLETEKVELSQQNTQLAKKVSKASTVKVNNIDVTGVQIKSSGRERRRRRASSVDRLNICFTLEENIITDPGYERFYIRILSPQGETLSVEGLGSGIFISSENNQRIRFTQIKELEYDNTTQETCLHWEQDGPFTQGEYTVEVYNKGYLSGTGTFQLK